MAKFTSMLALFALNFVNVAVGSTAFSSDVAPAPSSVEISVPIIYSTVLSTSIVPAAPSSEAFSTTCTTVTVTTAVTSTVTMHSSLPSAIPNNSTFIHSISRTALPTHVKSTVVVTHTANHTSAGSTGGAFKPTATASLPPYVTNAATDVDFGYAALAIAIGAAVLAI